MSTKERKIRAGATAIQMSQRQKRLLTDYSKKREIPHHHKKRLSLLVLAAEGFSHNFIARAQNTTVNRVKFWRKKWESGQTTLTKFEEGQLGNGVKDHQLLKEMLKRLEDAPRSGTPATISQSQKAQIVALACESPGDYGLPQTVWTYPLLQEVILQKAILPSLHQRTVGKILKNVGVTTPQK
jgi:hypothetical protein